jgi:acetylornithine deacetylase/succinyl-diaminopimelate desuccinylase-like protein
MRGGRTVRGERKSLESTNAPPARTFSAKDEGGGLVTITATGKSAHGSRPEQGINAAGALLQYLGTLPWSPGKTEKPSMRSRTKSGLISTASLRSLIWKTKYRAAHV